MNRILIPVAIVVVFALWAFSAVVIVREDQQAVIRANDTLTTNKHADNARATNQTHARANDQTNKKTINLVSNVQIFVD